MKNRFYLGSTLGICLSLFVFTTELQANPTGGSIAGGSASIAGQGTSTVTVNQTSNTAIINWNTFSINQGELTKFVQPSASSAVLNRVTGGATSQINGTLSANGQVYLVNGNGVIVGPSGVVNAAGFTASTRDISDSDFLSGNLHFAGSSSAGVQNFGVINALGGDAILIGKTVDNQGTIIAANGTAGLVSGDNILLAQKNADGSTIAVNPATFASRASDKVGVHNSGTIAAAAAELKAANGNIYALAIQNEGVVRASTVKQQGGHIWLTSDTGTVSNSGTLDASAIAAKSKGGNVALKSTRGTVSHTGKIIAEGGQGGAGGNAEISGAQIQFTGTIDLTAQEGTLGDLLLDPATMNIIMGGESSLTGSMVDPGAIVSALNGANVTLQADKSITVTNAVNASGNASAGDLTLNTATDYLNAAITLKSGSRLSGTATTVNVGENGLVQNAVDASNSTTAPTINLASGATYGLTSEIFIGKSLTLDGNGAILDGSNGAGFGNGVTRVMEIGGNASGIMVNLNGLTIENGNARGGRENGLAGGLLIYAEHDVTNVIISNSTISNNSAATASGGGIFNDGSNGGAANLTIFNSTISGNSAVSGAGIYNNGSAGRTTLAITNSTISGNSGSPGNSNIYGAGIYNDGSFSGNATLTINISSILDNSGDTSGTLFTAGGGIFNDGYRGNASAAINNSTLAGNSATNGAALYNNGEGNGHATLSVMNSTISGNSTGTGPATGGGGIYNDTFGSNATVTVRDTILAGNLDASGEDDYVANSGATLISAGYNLYGQNGNAGGFVGNGTTDIRLAGNISTVLAPLANNGGPTQTMALVTGSAAIAAGGISAAYELDQRGYARSSIQSIGAYEYNAHNPFLVTSAVDPGTIQIGTLRTALGYANANPLFDPIITFDSANLFSTAQTITLSYGQLIINSSLAIDGPTQGVTLDANNVSRVMEIDGSASGISVNLNNLKLENGNGVGTNMSQNGGGLLVFAENGTQAAILINNCTITNNVVSGNGSGGGGILNDAGGGNSTLVITNSTISHNTASNAGGGIDNNGPTTDQKAGPSYAALTITSSTISDNSAFLGGGIFNEGVYGGAALTISDSTLSGNTASYVGAIYNFTGALTVNHSTISGNSASNSVTAVGGIFNYTAEGTATLTINDTILAGNTAAGAELDYSSTSGTLVDKGYNLYGQNGSDGGFSGNSTTDIKLAGDISTVLDTTLANNGGQTQTLALVVGSVAIDAGDPVLIETMDQRGIVRGSPPAGTGSAADIGAYEAAIVKVTASDQQITYGQSLPTLTYTVNSGLSGLLTGSLALITPETNVGVYIGDIGQGTLALTDSAYLLDFTPGTLKIYPEIVAVTVKVQPGSSVYGANLSALTPGLSVTGLVNGDTVSDLGYTSVITGTGSGISSTTDVGKYKLTIGGALTDQNYVLRAGTLSPVGKTTTWSVAKDVLTVSGLTGTSVYGQAPTTPSAPYLITSSNGITNQTALLNLLNNTPVTTAYSFNINSATGAGKYSTDKITAKVALAGGVNAKDYTLKTVAHGAWTVTPDIITIAGLTNGSSSLGTIPVFNGGTYFAVSDLDNSSNVDTFVTGAKATLKVTAKSKAGTYAAPVTGKLNSVRGKVNGVSAKDYKLVLQSGSWQVVP